MRTLRYLFVVLCQLGGCHRLVPTPNHVASFVKVQGTNIVLTGYIEQIEREREIRREKYFLTGIVVRGGEPINGRRDTLWQINCFPTAGDYWTQGTTLPMEIIYGESPCEISAEKEVAKNITVGIPINFSIGIIGMNADDRDSAQFSSSAEFMLITSEGGELLVEKVRPR